MNPAWPVSPAHACEAARKSAADKGHGDTTNPAWRFTLHMPSQEPVMVYAQDETLRREVWLAATSVGAAGEHDNRPLVPEILALRDEEAKLLGKAHFADQVLARRMAGSGEHALGFLNDLQGKAQDSFQRECGWENEPVATVDGTLPIRLPLVSPYWEINDGGEIDAQIVLESSPNLWRKLAQQSRVQVENPAFNLKLSGTWNRPTGEGQLSVGKITVSPKLGEIAWPVISDMRVDLVDDGCGLAVEPLTARFDGQTITLRGQLPFTAEEWTEVSEAPLRYFREQGRGSISIPRAEFSALAKFVPDMLVPTGQVELALEYAPGLGVDGRLVLDGAVTRPLGPLGALQDVTADLRFVERGLEIKEVKALMGGRQLKSRGRRNGRIPGRWRWT